MTLRHGFVVALCVGVVMALLVGVGAASLRGVLVASCHDVATASRDGVGSNCHSSIVLVASLEAHVSNTTQLCPLRTDMKDPCQTVGDSCGFRNIKLPTLTKDSIHNGPNVN